MQAENIDKIMADISVQVDDECRKRVAGFAEASNHIEGDSLDRIATMGLDKLYDAIAILVLYREVTGESRKEHYADRPDIHEDAIVTIRGTIISLLMGIELSKHMTDAEMEKEAQKRDDATKQKRMKYN